MRYSKRTWEQLKNLTADEIISALIKDGWQLDKSSGAYRPFVNPVTRSRVIIHYHPRKTFGPKLLKALLDDIDWTEEDLKRLGLIAAIAGATSSRQRLAEIGDENLNGQVFAVETDQAGTDHNQYIWILLCRHCGNRYGANGSDFHHRKCPKCQGGAAGLEIAEI